MSDDPAILKAAYRGDIKAIQAELDKGIDVNTASSHGWTALDQAVYKGNLKVVEFLVERKAHPDTALHLACQDGRVQIVKFLLDSGADINIRGNGGWTVLMRACVNNQLDVIKQLVERRADCSLKDSNGQSALEWAHDSIKHLLVPVPVAPPAPFPSLLQITAALERSIPRASGNKQAMSEQQSHLRATSASGIAPSSSEKKKASAASHSKASTVAGLQASSNKSAGGARGSRHSGGRRRRK